MKFIMKRARKLKTRFKTNSTGPNEAQLRKINQYKEMYQEIVEFCGPLTGLRVLEVGSGGGKYSLSAYLAENSDARSVVAIDPVASSPRKEGKLEVRCEDIRHTSFGEGEFDLVVSIAAFEHIADLDVALEEMYRIVRPGGLLYTKFGPIWSGPWGHHLWVQGEHQLYTYNNTCLPAYCHLLMSEHELIEHCKGKLGIAESDAHTIAQFVYHSPEQNRLFFSDYEDLVFSSKFDVLFFYGTNKFPLVGGYAVSDYKVLMRELLNNYPAKKGWSYNSVFTLLQRP